MSKKNPISSEDELLSLREELECERRRTAALERELSSLKRELKDTENRDKPLRSPLRRRSSDDASNRKRVRMQDSAARRAQHYRRGSFVRYAYESVMDSLPVRILAQLWAYLRRLRIVQFVLTLAPAIVAVVLVSVLSAAALPFLILGTALMAMLGGLRAKRQNRRLRQALDGKHIRVLIPARVTDPLRHIFFMENARAMATDENTAVLIVSPYSFSSRGINGRGAYLTARQEGENLYLVRRYYYFTLRRRVLDIIDPDMTVMY